MKQPEQKPAEIETEAAEPEKAFPAPEIVHVETTIQVVLGVKRGRNIVEKMPLKPFATGEMDADVFARLVETVTAEMDRLQGQVDGSAGVPTA